LGTLAFQVKLGSMLDKTHRIEKLVDDLAGWAGLGDAELVTTRRAAKLCKADLATKMVVEMTSLQGLMGRYYAFNSGEPEAVALAIFEHYLPRYTGDILPRTKPGLVVGLADRLDTLAGLFAIGLAPSGNKDPFAQRRAALGLVQNLIAWDLDFELDAAIRAAASHLPVPAKPEALVLVMVFIVERLRNLLLDQGAHFDVVDAVLAAQGNNPARAVRAVKELAGWTARPDWNSILPAYARCVRITRDLSERYPIDPEYFAEPAEVDLYAAVSVAMAARRSPGSMDDFLNSFFPLIPLINRFFDEVLVMAEDSRLRENRLGLVQRIAALASGVADMSKLEGF
jgi:glycyl-tRNA synthetase